MHIHNTSIGEIYHLRKNFHFVYPIGKLMIPHLLRYQGLAVDDYSLTSAELSRCPPFLPRICGILNFRSFRVQIIYRTMTGLKTHLRIFSRSGSYSVRS